MKHSKKLHARIFELLHQDRYEKAKSTLDRYSGLTHISAQHSLYSLIYALQAKWDAALNALDNGISDCGGANLKALKFNALIQSGKIISAIKHLDDFLGSNDDCLNEIIMFALEDHISTDAALDYLETIVSLNGKSALVLLEIARLSVLSGRLDKCISTISDLDCLSVRSDASWSRKIESTNFSSMIDDIQDARDQYKKSCDNVLSDFERLYGQKIIPVLSRHQSLFACFYPKRLRYTALEGSLPFTSRGLEYCLSPDFFALTAQTVFTIVCYEVAQIQHTFSTSQVRVAEIGSGTGQLTNLMSRIKCIDLVPTDIYTQNLSDDPTNLRSDPVYFTYDLSLKHIGIRDKYVTAKVIEHLPDPNYLKSDLIVASLPVFDSLGDTPWNANDWNKFILNIFNNSSTVKSLIVSVNSHSICDFSAMRKISNEYEVLSFQSMGGFQIICFRKNH